MNIIAFTGAGMSAESGIPTFRTGSNGLWENHSIKDVCTPAGFERDPQLVWSFYRERYLKYSIAQPNAGHYAITDLQSYCAEKGITFNVITQNVDMLHQRANTKDVIELHGNIAEFRCNSCNFYTYDNYWRFENIQHCPKCKADYIRPAIVWFNEMLPFEPLQRAYDLSKIADKILVIGTSAQVFPAADIIYNAYRTNNAMIIEFNIQKLFEWIDHRYQYWGNGSAVDLPTYVNSFKETYK